MTIQKTFLLCGLAFACMAFAATWWQQPWLLVVPILLLLAIWAFEKPVLLFYTLIASVPWSIEYHFSESLGTDFPDEPLMWLSALVALLLMVHYHKQLRQKIGGSVLLLLLLLQLVWAALTIFTSTQPLLSLKYCLAKSWYLLSFVVLPLFVLHTKKRVKQTALVLSGSMILAVVVALVRHAQTGFTFASINESLTPFFRNHVNYSALLVCTIPLLTLFFKNATGSFLKWMVGGLLIVMLAALYFSYARGAWIALLTGAVAYGLLKKKALVFGFIITIIFTGASLFWFQYHNRYLNYANNYTSTIFHTNFAEHLVATYQLRDLSTAERFYRWVAGARMVKDGWETGFGPNTFYNNYKSYTIPLFKTWVSANEEHSTVHNYFLLLLIEQGIMGLLLFLVVLVVAFATVQQLYHATTDVFWKHTLVIIAVALAMICTVNFLSDLIETDKVGSVFYLCLAVLMIANEKIKKELNPVPHIERIA